MSDKQNDKQTIKDLKLIIKQLSDLCVNFAGYLMGLFRRLCDL